MNYTGIVSGISAFPYNGKNLYSFQLEGIRSYFRVGEKAPSFTKGMYVEFTGEADAKGNVKVDLSGVVAKPTDGAPTVAAGVKSFRNYAKSAVANRPSTSEGYWEAKTTRDIETQKRIEIQSCRNSALQFITILLANEGLKIPAKNKLEFLEQLLEHYVVAFLKRNGGVDVNTPADAPTSNTESEAE